MNKCRALSKTMTALHCKKGSDLVSGSAERVVVEMSQLSPVSARGWQQCSAVTVVISAWAGIVLQYWQAACATSLLLCAFLINGTYLGFIIKQSTVDTDDKVGWQWVFTIYNTIVEYFFIDYSEALLGDIHWKSVFIFADWVESCLRLI